MLQRAASNACSWWWASHIRTKQSKFLEQSLQDMEDKVQKMLQLIQGNGDSFAKRAEMYYRCRPELVDAVEESFRAFKALADRYELLSKELQNANHTIATVFPEQVQFSLEDYYDEDFPPPPMPQLPTANPPTTIPQAPDPPPPPSPPAPPSPQPPAENPPTTISEAPDPSANIKDLVAQPGKQLPGKKTDGDKKVVVKKSGLTKEEAEKEIYRVHKEILAQQTVREFVKSSYESGLAKYWDIENRINDMHSRVIELQDEFDVEVVIEDDEARKLMVEAAVESCERTLNTLREKHINFVDEEKEELRKIESARELLNSLRSECLQDDGNEESGRKLRQEMNVAMADPLEFKETLTVAELAEKVDEVVNEVIGMETSVSTQMVLINTVRTEADDLIDQVRTLNEEKETMMGDMERLKSKVKELEDKLRRVEDLNDQVESQNDILNMQFDRACVSLDHLSKKMNGVRPDEEIDNDKDDDVLTNSDKSYNNIDASKEDEPEEEQVDAEEASINETSFCKIDEQTKTPSDQESAKHSEERERMLLQEYTEILKNYKDVRKKQRDAEKKEKDRELDKTQQINDLKESITEKDREIQTLHETLNFLRANTVAKELLNTEELPNVEQLPNTEELPNEEQLPNTEELSNAEEIPNTEELPSNLISETCTESVTEECKFLDRACEDKTKLTKRKASVIIDEEKVRTEIDAFLDESMDFWLRFSTAYYEVQKFRSEIDDLQDEIWKLREKKKHEGVTPMQLKSEARSHYKHLREIQTELTVWLEQSSSLTNELQRRFSMLCNILDSEEEEEEEMGSSSILAAKLHGEIWSMKQENNKVREELRISVYSVGKLQDEINKVLRQLKEEFGVSSDQPQLKKSLGKARMPLRSFIFGPKQKKQPQRPTVFPFMHQHRKIHVT